MRIWIHWDIEALSCVDEVEGDTCNSKYPEYHEFEDSGQAYEYSGNSLCKKHFEATPEIDLSNA